MMLMVFNIITEQQRIWQRRTINIHAYLRGDLEVEEIVSKGRDTDGGGRHAVGTQSAGVAGGGGHATMSIEEPEGVSHIAAWPIGVSV